MNLVFENIVDDNGLERPKGMMKQEGKTFYFGQEALEKLIGSELNVSFDERYVIRYNNTNLYSYGGIASHMGKEKIVIAITNVGEGYRYFIKKADDIESEARTGSWSIREEEYSQITPIQDVKELNTCIVNELKKYQNGEKE